MRKLLFISALLFSVLAFGQDTNQNYVKVITYRDSLSQKPHIQLTYYDGLGKPIQNIVHKQSNSGNDIVTHMEYDAYGRQVKDFLPYPSSLPSLSYNSGAVGEVYRFYSSDTYENTSNPYSEKLLEASPLNRVLKQAAPGNDWALGRGNEIIFDYQANEEADEVKLFRVSATPDGQNISISDMGYYDANELYKSITKDENWQSGKNNTTEEFRDKESRVVLKRTFSNIIEDGVLIESAAKHDTYYVYDIYGNLTYVIPPLVNGSIDNLDGLCYQYKYDYRNRLVEKKLPGKQWEFIIYDKLDRPVATGPVFTPYGGSDTGWLITQYDNFGRVTKTGWKQMTVDAGTRSTNQNLINKGSNPFALSQVDILTENFYDSYSFAGGPSPVPTDLADSTYHIAQNVKGLQTGSWTKVLDTPDSNSAEVSYTLYDDKYRPVRIHTTNYLGGYTEVDTNLDWSGKINYTVKRHKYDINSTELVVKDMFTYTDQDRLALHKQKIGQLEEQLIASNTYDELGQLISKNVGGAISSPLQKVDYSYSIRGWLKEINNVNDLSEDNDLFAFKISYNKTVDGNATPLYNGNISETYWKSGSDNHIRKYTYEYDALNRLLEANYEKNSSGFNSYREKISYDKNGNIQNLSRNGNMDTDGFQPVNLIDNLKYNYDAQYRNQLMMVADFSGSPQGFKDDADSNVNPDTSIDYGYDANGNMTSDANKLIDLIIYNHLNLPTKIHFLNGNEINYTYSASGKKIAKKVNNYSFLSFSNVVYLDGFHYIQNKLEFITNPAGYVKVTYLDQIASYNYVFNYTDHLGNIRLSYAADPNTQVATIIEENHYYPFGLKHTNYNSDILIFIPFEENTVSLRRPPIEPIPIPYYYNYNYKYNGKEFQDELGLNTYDYGFRTYDPAIARWMQMDPLLNDLDFKFDPNDIDDDDDDEVASAMETTLGNGGGIFNPDNLNPYSYGYNDPIRFDDPDGRCPICIYVIAALVFSEFANAPTGDTKADARNYNASKENKTIVSAAVLAGGARQIVTNSAKAKVVEKVVEKTVEKTKKEKTYQTYTKENKKTGETYSGRTSGTGKPLENVAKRDKTHHKNKEGYGPAKLDKSSKSKDAIRGREQQLIERHGGAKSEGGTSGNSINGVSPKNPKAEQYNSAANKEFGT